MYTVPSCPMLGERLINMRDNDAVSSIEVIRSDGSEDSPDLFDDTEGEDE